MKKLLVWALLLLVPFAAAHENHTHDDESSPVDSALGPGVSGPNDFSRVNPFVLVSDGRWGAAAGFLGVWSVLLLGLWQLVRLVLGRVMAVRGRE